MRNGMKWTVLALLALASGGAGAAVVVKDGRPVAKAYYLADEGTPRDWIWQKPDKKSRKRSAPTREEIVSNYFCQAMFDIGDAVERISGAKLEFVAVKGVDEVKGPAVVIGRLAGLCGVKPASAEDPLGETYAIKADGERLYLAGNGGIGSVYAIYDFLNGAGAEWLMPDRIGFACEKKSTIEVADGVREERPGFKVRAPWLSGGSKTTAQESHEYFKWQMRNREQLRTLGVHGTFIAERSPRIVWRNFKGKKYDKWFEEHPECAALQVAADGTEKRSRYQLNLLAPASEELVLGCIREAYEKNGWAKDERHVLNVEPSDGGGFDMSDASVGYARGVRDPIEGDLDQTDAVFGFLGRVLDRATNEFPNVWFTTLVYNNYADFPRKRPPHPRNILTIADITHSRYHGVCDAGVSPSRAYYKGVVEKWAKTGNVFTFYHYNWNLADALLPYTRIRIVGEDVPWEHEIGSAGYQDEHLQGLSFSAPHDWLFAKLMWKPEKGAWKGLVEKFCRLAYGAGWKEMHDYWMYLVEKQRASGDESGAYVAAFHMWTQPDFERMKAWLSAAEDKAAGVEEKARVRVAAYAVDQLGRFLDYTEAFSTGRYADCKRAVDAIIAAEDAAKSGEYPQAAARWTFVKFMLERFASAAVRYSTPSTNGNYRVVAELPERMRMQYLPQPVGERMNLQSPLLRDEEFPEVSTWKSDVSRQGMIGARFGELWYRAKVKIPDVKLADGEGIGLFLGGFDNNATVYVNGVKAGSARGFAKNAQFDVTDYLAKDGAENTVVICITRRGNSESLTGGILFPGWFFAGPRVPKSADAPDDFKIILPGMAN